MKPQNIYWHTYIFVITKIYIININRSNKSFMYDRLNYEKTSLNSGQKHIPPISAKQTITSCLAKIKSCDIQFCSLFCHTCIYFNYRTQSELLLLLLKELYACKPLLIFLCLIYEHLQNEKH